MCLILVLRAIREPFRKSEQEMFSRLSKPGTLLDASCGSEERIPDGYYTPYGIELSRELCRMVNMRMKPRGGFCIHAPAVEGIGQFESGLFTGVILRSFLEHEWKPMELLASVHRVLRDDGIIFVRVSNYTSLNRKVRGGQWCGFRLSGLCQLFHSIRSLSNGEGQRFSHGSVECAENNHRRQHQVCVDKTYFCELSSANSDCGNTLPKIFASKQNRYKKPCRHSTGKLPCA